MSRRTPVVTAAAAEQTVTFRCESDLFFSALADLRTAFSDVVLLVGGARLPAHRLVLSAWSSPFRAMFTTSGMRESGAVEVALQVEEEPFEALLDFLYSGSVTIAKDSLIPLWVQADLWQVTALTNCIEGFLVSHLDPYSVPVVLATADVLNASAVRAAALEFACQHIGEMLESVGWSPEYLSPDLAREVLSSQEIAAPEAVVLNAALSYMASSPGEHEDLVDCVRLDLIPAPVLRAVLGPDVAGYVAERIDASLQHRRRDPLQSHVRASRAARRAQRDEAKQGRPRVWIQERPFGRWLRAES